ncbi:unnamed protein product [Haemonchus placei]|uniref:Uncharacterized protein n=1 Tax=Haemonchus placei TaxID=6290 RepID=A0A0N4WNA5_HAEPC|nr:unnamed protein product [Haemonchus placei]
MWMLICFFLPAILFCICALIVWLRVLHVNRRREKRDKRDRKLEDAKQLEK